MENPGRVVGLSAGYEEKSCQLDHRGEDDGITWSRFAGGGGGKGEQMVR